MHTRMQEPHASLLISLFLPSVLQGWIHGNDHGNTTARAQQSAQWGSYLEKVNFLLISYISPSAKGTGVHQGCQEHCVPPLTNNKDAFNLQHQILQYCHLQNIPSLSLVGSRTEKLSA